MKLKDKVAIVTGGTMGIGLGIVKVFVKYGAKVVILDQSTETPNIVSQAKEKGFEVEGHVVDVRDNVKVKEIIDEVASRYGNIDVLVNNAGTIRLKSFLETTEEDRDFQIDVNVKGAWNVSQATVPHMKNGGAIVNLSSVTGPLVADPGEVAYALTKSAIQGFTKGLAAELVSQKIRVNCIQPGYIRTPLADAMARDNGLTPEEFVAEMSKSIPMNRLGTIEEAGELVAFLASEEASYITGQAVVIDGGSTLPETTVVNVE